MSSVSSRFSLLSGLTALAVLTSGVEAQKTFSLDIDAAQSQFTWAGTTSFGPLNPTSSNQFALSGVVSLDLTAGALAIETGQFTGGVATVAPDLSGFVPNAFPFLPPLALIDVTNLTLALDSPPFAVAADGSFTADVSFTSLTGTLTVQPLIGDTTVTDLAGNVGAPASFSGVIDHVNGNITLNTPMGGQFMFDDATSGSSGDFTLDGDLIADWDCTTPVSYCTAKVNSMGCTPSIGHGSGFASYSDPAPFEITAADVLGSRPGLLFYGVFGDVALPFQGGTLCVAPPLRRTGVQFSTGAPSGCAGTYTFDLNAWAQGGNDALLVPGQQVNAQYWSRDPASSNGTGLTNGLELVICP